MKKSKKNYIAIVLVVLLLALAVGYAAFSQTLPINGTATASGNWNVKFTNATATKSIVDGTEVNTAVVAADGKSVTVTVHLATPGDGSNIKTVISNLGELDAKLTNFKVEGEGFAATVDDANVYKNGAILVKVPTVTTGSTLAKTTGTNTFEFSVEWDPTVTELTTAQTATFTITFDYEQAGVNGSFTGTQRFN